MNLREYYKTDLEEFLEKDSSILFYHFVKYDLSSNWESGEFIKSDSLFSDKSSIYNTWAQGLFHLPLEERSFINLLFKQFKKKYSIHLNYSLIENNEDPSLSVEFWGRDILINIKIQKLKNEKIIQLKQEVLKKGNIEDYIKHIHNDEKFKSSLFCEVVYAEIKENVGWLLDSFSLNDEREIEIPLKAVLNRLMCFLYPTTKTKQIQYSVFIVPGYEKGDIELTSGGIVVFFKPNKFDEEFKSKIRLINIKTALWSNYETVDSLLISSKKATIKSAIIQYMARNLSHNTGSHLIPEAITYFSKVINTNDDIITKLIRDRFTYYQKYTQERMELLAQLSSMKNNHNWSNYNLDQIVEEFNSSIIPKGLCDDLNNNQKEIEIILKNRNNDIYVSLPDGAVGKQAFYVILENFVRNAYKHADAGPSYLFEIYVSQPNDSFHKQDFWCVDIYDKLGNLNESKRTSEKLKEINKQISDSVLTENSQLRDNGWGLLEMKSAAAFLVGFPLENLDDFELANFETRYYSTTIPPTNKNIGHRFYLRKPRILLIDSDVATQEQKNNEETLKSIGIQIEDFHRNIDKEPHQFLLTDKKIEFTNQKIIDCTMNTNQRISEIENDLWKEYIKVKNWNNFKIISSLEEQNESVVNSGFLDQHGTNLFFDSHGKELRFDGQRLKEVNADYIKSLNLPFYHPYKSRSGIGSLLLKSKIEDRFKGLLLESAFKKILIIDERIQNASRAKDNEQSNLTLQEIFSFMGITVPLRNKLNLSGFLENPSNEKADEIVQLILDRTYDYVLIHLTILEKLAGRKEKKELENFISNRNKLNEPENFKALNRALVLVSGRGEPPNLPRNSFYLNYTTLYDCLIYLMSKPHLVQILNTLRRR